MKKQANTEDNLINNDFIDLDDLTAQAENIDVVIRNVDYYQVVKVTRLF